MPARIQKALDGERDAARSLVDELSPVIQARIVRSLARRSEAAGGRDVRQEVRDLTQHMFLLLFADGGRVLRQWDPARGSSLQNFVGLVVEREAASILRRRRRNPWGEHPTEDEDFERMSHAAPGPESQTISRDLLRRAIVRARARLSDRGLALFQWIIVEDRSVEEVCALANMTPEAVYAWRSRLARLLREIAAEGMSEGEGTRRSPPTDGANDG
ncbi:MAG: hypothetical protein ABJE95_34995 [Byssovorax sp.]